MDIRLTEFAALATHCGFCSAAQRKIIAEAEAGRDYYTAARAETKLELYGWFEHKLIKILME